MSWVIATQITMSMLTKVKVETTKSLTRKYVCFYSWNIPTKKISKLLQYTNPSTTTVIFWGKIFAALFSEVDMHSSQLFVCQIWGVLVQKLEKFSHCQYQMAQILRAPLKSIFAPKHLKLDGGTQVNLQN